MERGLYLVALIVEVKSVGTEGSGCLHRPMLGGLKVCLKDDLMGCTGCSQDNYTSIFQLLTDYTFLDGDDYAWVSSIP